MVFNFVETVHTRNLQNKSHAKFKAFTVYINGMVYYTVPTGYRKNKAHMICISWSLNINVKRKASTSFTRWILPLLSTFIILVPLVTYTKFEFNVILYYEIWTQQRASRRHQWHQQQQRTQSLQISTNQMRWYDKHVSNTCTVKDYIIIIQTKCSSE